MQMAERAPRGPARFRERDVKAAVRAVRAAGEEVAGVEIGVDGKIKVIVGREPIAAPARNPWDDED
jgi:hypothetical protein